MTNLYELYNRYNNFDRYGEYEKFKKDIEIRCNNLIICGDSLPFHIRDNVIIVYKLSGTLKYRHY